MKIRDFALAGVFALTMTPALAQTPGSLNVFGVVDKIDATSIVVKKEDGALATFPLAPTSSPTISSRPPPSARKTANCIRRSCASSPTPCVALARVSGP
jgi:hypothetical protein